MNRNVGTFFQVRRGTLTSDLKCVWRGGGGKGVGVNRLFSSKSLFFRKKLRGGGWG